MWSACAPTARDGGDRYDSSRDCICRHHLLQNVYHISLIPPGWHASWLWRAPEDKYTACPLRHSACACDSINGEGLPGGYDKALLCADALGQVMGVVAEQPC
jgi:hypothetical protein